MIMRKGLFYVTFVVFLSAVPALAQPGTIPPDKPPLPGALNQIPVPLPPNLNDFVADKQAAIVLGKALFWDQQAGSDGLACASCHFHAGADNRIKNQMNPDLRNENPALQNIWNLTASNKNQKGSGPPPGGGPNYSLALKDFPLHQLDDITSNNSRVLFDSDDIVGSQGVFREDFQNISALPKDHPKKQLACGAALSSTFSVKGVNTRQVEPRNTPTVINAIFNFRNFWDGRANNIFNGRSPFGPRDPTAGVDPENSILVTDSTLNTLTPIQVAIPDASLASQAVGPPGIDLEMSCRGRVFEEIGQKMLAAKPLANQSVDPTDSVLGPHADKKQGLTITYDALIKKAFLPKFWRSARLSQDGYTQIVKNFSLFWGLSIMLYESTLVSDQAPFDQYANGNITAMNAQQVSGFQVFTGNGGCISCHKGPEFTGAASALKTAQHLGAQVEHMIMGDGNISLSDSGFYNLGVTPPGNDLGIGEVDPYGNPLSFSRQAKNAVAANQNATKLSNVGPDGINVFTCNFDINPCFPVSETTRDSVDGAFKVPSLRNVELTGPYFHNGGQATLEQVVAFYNRGGDGAGSDAANTTGYGPNLTNRAPAIFPLHLSATDQTNLVEFLKALTDERVRWEMAPFDHPSLSVPNGHSGDATSVKKDGNTGYAVDDNLDIRAVGAAGRPGKKQPPLASFETLLLPPGQAVNLTVTSPPPPQPPVSPPAIPPAPSSTIDPPTSASFDTAISGMQVLKDYEFGTGTGRNVKDISDLAASFNPYGIAGTTVINNEWERYQAFNNSNFVFSPSSMALTATLPSGGGVWNGGINSGQIVSQQTFQPNVTGNQVYAFEFRAQTPGTPGMWPAFWFYVKDPNAPNRDGSEIDVEFFDMADQNSFDWTGFNHGPGLGNDIYSIQTNQWMWHPGYDFAADYHNYQFYWTPDMIYKYVDGVLIKQTAFKWTAGSPAQFIVNLAVGSDTVGQGLKPASSSQFPARLQIDHIKIWSK
jgi:cytochrome c peroxidase